MKILKSILLASLLLSFTADGKFPEVSGKTLTGKAISVPSDSKGDHVDRTEHNHI